MITEFGKYLRKLRIDSNEILQDMARRLGVSASFLSAVEVGKKNVPEGWIRKISDEYGLSPDKEVELCGLAEDAVKSVKINLFGSGDAQRTAALTFARNFDDLPPETASQIIKLIHDSGKEGR